jgi:predicted phage baseplate assembly protein
VQGNVAAEKLESLKSAIPGVASVKNPMAAHGGVDTESLDSARLRAAMEIRTRHRAVTAADFEFLAVRASPRVSRARCVAAADGKGHVKVHLLPRLAPADRRLEYDELRPDDVLLEGVAAYLDERRLVGTVVELLPARLRGVSVVVNVQASRRASLPRVEQEIAYALYTYLNPLVGGSPDGPADGWPFGRTLNQGELYGIVHSIDGVEFVRFLRIYEADIETGAQQQEPVGSHLTIEPHEVIASATHHVKAEYAGT